MNGQNGVKRHDERQPEGEQIVDAPHDAARGEEGADARKGERLQRGDLAEHAVKDGEEQEQHAPAREVAQRALRGESPFIAEPSDERQQKRGVRKAAERSRRPRKKSRLSRRARRGERAEVAAPRREQEKSDKADDGDGREDVPDAPERGQRTAGKIRREQEKGGEYEVRGDGVVEDAAHHHLLFHDGQKGAKEQEKGVEDGE